KGWAVARVDHRLTGKPRAEQLYRPAQLEPVASRQLDHGWRSVDERISAEQRVLDRDAGASGRVTGRGHQCNAHAVPVQLEISAVPRHIRARALDIDAERVAGEILPGIG